MSVDEARIYSLLLLGGELDGFLLVIEAVAVAKLGYHVSTVCVADDDMSSDLEFNV